MVQALGATALTVAALMGAGWGLAGMAAWLLANLAVTARAGLAGLRAGRGVVRTTGATALTLGLPFLAAFGALVPRIGSSAYSLPAVAASVAAALTGWIPVAAALQLVKIRRKRAGAAPSPPVPSQTRFKRLLAALLTVSLFAVPLVADAAARRALERRIGPCREMRPQRPGATQWSLRILAEACGQRAGDAESRAVADTRIDVYAGGRNADVPAVTEDAVSIVVHLTEVLGPPSLDRITVSPVAIPGPVRAMAGPGYLLIDSAELVSPRACRSFRSSAGTEGECGSWVLAHELAHQWFPGTAVLGPSTDEVAWEATADYLAWDWWRSEFGEADALRLQEELFEGRVRLAHDFATTNAPADPPGILTDSQSRALIYGRGPLGWVAAEREAGRDAVRAVLEEAFAGTGSGDMTLATILEAAEPVPQVAQVLDRWWLDPSFDGGTLTGGVLLETIH